MITTTFFKRALSILVLMVSLGLSLSHSQTEIDTQWANQINPIFNGLDKTKVPHGVLLDYAMEFTNVPAYNGTLTDSTFVDANVLGNIYKTLFMGKVTTTTTNFPKLEDLASQWVNQRHAYNTTTQETLVIAGLYYKYARIKSTALSSNNIRVSWGRYYDKYIGGVWQNPYEILHTAAFTPPVSNYNKRQFEVVLPQALRLSNNASGIQNIELNTGDGSGYQSINNEQVVHVNYAKNGIYTWVFKTTLTNGQVLYSHSKISIKAPLPKTQKKTAQTRANENNILISGPSGSGFPFLFNGAVLRIDYAPSHNGQLTKPFIVAEGFDAGSILTPEVAGGDRTLNDFLNNSGDLPSSGDLRSLLLFDSTQEYDIVYIDWQNGTNSLQHNSAVLKNVLDWVNTHKVGNEPNVLLGQSMGGVIGRYTLATMETASQTHDVRLFVAHDAPMQGANTPLSLQYFSRHAYDQYTEAPILYGALEVIIPTFLNLVELMSFGNVDIAIPSLEDYLTLNDTPAAVQLNYHYADITSNPTKTLHNNWQQEFEVAGYPAQCRNIAISNGNECAVDHGFDPRDKFIDLDDTHNPDFFGDLLHLVVTPLAGYLTSDLELYFLGLLPGSSKYFFDFDLHSNPNVGQSSRRVYHGKIRYEKKLLWLVAISHTITERNKNAPHGYLPFDTYSGGYYDINTVLNSFENILPSGTVVNPRYGFIPVVSALDIKRNNTGVQPDDYLKNYAGGTTPEPALTSGFNNFIVDFNNAPINNRHISFQRRNGDWLADELDEATNLLENCSVFCDNIDIEGPDVLCTTGTYTFDTATLDDIIVNWSLVSTNAAQIVSSSGASVVVQAFNGYSSEIELIATITSAKCDATTTKTRTIWAGKPKSPTSLTGPTSVNTGALVNYVSGVSQGATSYKWWLPYPYGESNPIDYFADEWQMQPTNHRYLTAMTGYAGISGLVQVMGVNACGCGGAKMLSVSHDGGGGGIAIAPPQDDETVSYFKVYPNPVNSETVIRLKNTIQKPEGLANAYGELYDILGTLIKKIDIREDRTILNIEGLPSGVYILNFISVRLK